jgi:hypothetical protein
VPPVNFYRAVQGREPRALASAVALTFMGERTQGWPEARLAGMAGFFSDVGYKSTLEWKEEIVFFDRERRPEAERAAGGVFPDGTRRQFAPDEDPRQVFADWLIRPDNPWFARAIANRVWSWLLGRGVIHEPDDVRPDNPPANPELLAHLERELVAADWDLRHLFRVILTSRTYQRSAVAADTSALATANFAHYLARPLEAEVLIDAINQITGGTEEYSSAIPEPFTFVPDDRRSIQLADGSIGSAFLTTFGRPSRDAGLESERHRVASAAERLALLNSSHVQRKLETGQTAGRRRQRQARLPGCAGHRIGAPDAGGQLIDQLWLTILSRLPTPAETAAVADYAQARAAALRGGGRHRLALINTGFLTALRRA